MKRQSIGLPLLGQVPAAGSGVPLMTARERTGSFVPVRSSSPSAWTRMLIVPLSISGARRLLNWLSAVLFAMTFVPTALVVGVQPAGAELAEIASEVMRVIVS